MSIPDHSLVTLRISKHAARRYIQRHDSTYRNVPESRLTGYALVRGWMMVAQTLRSNAAQALTFAESARYRVTHGSGYIAGTSIFVIAAADGKGTVVTYLGEIGDLD